MALSFVLKLRFTLAPDDFLSFVVFTTITLVPFELGYQNNISTQLAK